MSLCGNRTTHIAPANLALSHDDITKGWTIRMLTAASSLYRRGDRAPITVDGYRRYELARKRSRRAARIYARPQPVDLDEVMYLLGAGETLTVSVNYGVTDGIAAAATFVSPVGWVLLAIVLYAPKGLVGLVRRATGGGK